MSCPAVSFEDVNDILYARLLQQAVRAGAKFSETNERSMEISGCSISWERTNATLTVFCMKKPFFVSCETLAAKFSDLLQKAREAV